MRFSAVQKRDTAGASLPHPRCLPPLYFTLWVCCFAQQQAGSVGSMVSAPTSSRRGPSDSFSITPWLLEEMSDFWTSSSAAFSVAKGKGTFQPKESSFYYCNIPNNKQNIDG